MKGMLKRALAGVAAAALAVTGLAAASGSAMAATDDASITLSGSTAAGTTYRLYKIGSYVEADAVVSDGALTAVGVDTDQSFEQCAVNALGDDVTSNAEYKAYGDPLAYVAGTTANGNANSTELQSFVDALAECAATGDIAATASKSVANDNDNVVFTGLDEGLYLVVSFVNDASGEATNTSAGRALAIIGTKVTVNGKEYTKLNDQSLGVAEVKPSTPQKPGKSHDSSSSGYYVGQTVGFTLTGVVPEYIGEDDSFAFVDTPGTGLTVDLTSVKAYIYGTNNQQMVAVTVTPDDTDSLVGDGSTSFTVSITDPSQYAGKTVTVTYDALINSQAAGEVENTVGFDNSSETFTDTITNVKTNTIEFTKVGVDEDENGLAGVKFTIKADGGNATGLPAGYQTQQISDSDGSVKFENLPNGTYTITETTPADRYLDTNTSFTVTVEDGAITSFTGDSLGLATQDSSDDTITVKNVKSITQLPQTGAAGIALFVVLGLLIAGAGVTVWMKSRNMRNAAAING